jgi:hypothetical protein
MLVLSGWGPNSRMGLCSCCAMKVESMFASDGLPFRAQYAHGHAWASAVAWLMMQTKGLEALWRVYHSQVRKNVNRDMSDNI